MCSEEYKGGCGGRLRGEHLRRVKNQDAVTAAVSTKFRGSL